MPWHDAPDGRTGLIAKTGLIGHNLNTSWSRKPVPQEIKMRGIGKLLASALLLTSSALILAPTEASAQFPNIDSIIRGAMQHGGGGYYRGSGGGSSHHTRSHSDDKESSHDNSPAKEKDATQDESPTANGGTRQTSSGSPSSGSSAHSQDSGSQQSPPPPSRTANDTPAFAPSR